MDLASSRALNATDLCSFVMFCNELRNRKCFRDPTGTRLLADQVLDGSTCHGSIHQPTSPGRAVRYNQEGHLVPKDWFVIVLPDDPGRRASWQTCSGEYVDTPVAFRGRGATASALILSLH